MADRFHRLDTEFRARDGYTHRGASGNRVVGSGLSARRLDRRTEEFSGGWQMRIALAKLLLEKPNLLLLDEPTNHLDLEARNWLEEYLADYPYAFVLISHDRYFLDVTVDRIAEIWNKRVYLLHRQLREVPGAKSRTAGAARSGLPESARAHRAARGVHQPLPLSGDQGEAGPEPDQRAGEDRAHRDPAGREDHPLLVSRSRSRAAASWRSFRTSPRATAEASCSADVNFIIERGDRVALVGVNGAGKSTLIKLLAGREPLTSGEYKLGHNAEPDYFAQDQYKELDPDARMIDDIRTVAPRTTETELRSLLGCFLFSKTTSSNVSACSRAASATATRWPGCC